MELWETADTMAVTYDDRAAPPDEFWGRFFPNSYTSEAQEIYFDRIQTRDRRLAPFVAPNVQGRIMRSRGGTVGSFRPAYVKPKHVVDPSRALVRRRGEPISPVGSSTMSPQERFDAIVVENLRTERELIMRRIDWMQCQALAYATVTVAGEDYPSVTVDYGRDASLTITPGVGLWWDANNGDPLADLQLGRARAFTLGQAPVNDLIFGSDAWAAFIAKDSVKALLDNQKRGSESNFNSTGLYEGAPVEYYGQISGVGGSGILRLWGYSNSYADDEGTTYDYIDSRDVVGVGGNIQATQAFGAIQDVASLQAVEMFSKMWAEQDPSVVYTMTQSAPLPIVANPNNSFRVRALG